MNKSNNILNTDIKLIQEQIYNKCGIELSNLKLNPESLDYGACSFDLNSQKVEHRTSKVTPTKSGQFVTIWKRNKEGITEPFDTLDTFDFVIITSKSNDKLGQFIFPKWLLAEKGIISQNGKGGKRGIRVYPPWDIATNKQALKTQSWQIKYFVNFGTNNSTTLKLFRRFFAETIIN